LDVTGCADALARVEKFTASMTALAIISRQSNNNEERGKHGNGQRSYDS